MNLTNTPKARTDGIRQIKSYNYLGVKAVTNHHVSAADILHGSHSR